MKIVDLRSPETSDVPFTEKVTLVSDNIDQPYTGNRLKDTCKSPILGTRRPCADTSAEFVAE